MGIVDSNGLPMALSAGSASPHKLKYVELTLDNMFVYEQPEKKDADKAYDSDPLDRRLMKERNV